jgi:hypothetical protein
MKHTTKFILFLIIFSLFLLTACGGQQSTDATTPPNADHLVKFNEEGIAVLRGYFSQGQQNPPSNGKPNMFIRVDINAKVDGIKGSIRVPFTMLYETVLSFSTVQQTTLREYMSSTPWYDITFPNYSLVDVAFRKNGTEFEALSVQEVVQKFTLFKKWENIDGLFHKDASGQLVAGGSFEQAYMDSDGTVTSWVFNTPIQMQGIQAEVILGVESVPSTRIINSQGTFDRTAGNHLGLVQIVYTRRGSRMIAKEITELR